MRIKVVLGIWLLGITLAWMAVVPPDLGVSPLVDAQGAALGWWQLRQHAIYLSGLWSIGLMSLGMLLALRLPLFDRALGGMDQVYRLHKWTGIAAALAAIAHWGAKESSGWIKTLWGRAGKPAHDAVLPWLTDSRGFAKDLGEWAFYLLLAMVVLTLVSRLLPYKHWRLLHRAMPVLFLALVFHAVAMHAEGRQLVGQDGALALKNHLQRKLPAAGPDACGERTIVGQPAAHAARRTPGRHTEGITARKMGEGHGKRKRIEAVGRNCRGSGHESGHDFARANPHRRTLTP